MTQVKICVEIVNLLPPSLRQSLATHAPVPRFQSSETCMIIQKWNAISKLEHI